MKLYNFKKISIQEKILCLKILDLYTVDEIAKQFNTNINAIRDKVRRISLKLGYKSANKFIKDLLLGNVI